MIEKLESRFVLASPSVVSIIPDPSQLGATVSAPRFVVTFSEAVTGVDAADFVAMPGPGVIVAPVPVGVTGSGATYTVTVNGVSGVGTLGLNLVDNSSIRDLGGNGLVGNGDGTFQSATNLAAGSIPAAVAYGDLNGDGRLDLVVANYGDNTVSVLRGNGDGAFQAALNNTVGSRPVSVAVLDLNGDGHRDLAVANCLGDSISVLLGNGNGTFQAAQNFSTGARPVSVVAGDLNGDGHPDLAVANFNDNSVSVLLGNGNGTFKTPSSAMVGTQPLSVAIGDIDGDGLLDLLTANGGSNSASVLLGNGNGTFQAAQNFNAGMAPLSVVIGDFDEDGHPDLATANRNSSSTSVLLGNGNGTFQAAQNFATGANPYYLAAADLNGDGRIDLSVANYGGNTVSVLLGNGNGTFRFAAVPAVGARPLSVAVGDVNSDGRQDLVVANRNSDTVSVLLSAAHGTFTGQTRDVAVAAPRVVSIVPDPAQPGTDLGSPRFVVTFSETVTGVDAADFVAMPGPGVIAAPVPVGVFGSGATYTVTVNGVSGVGTLGLNLVDNSSIRDLGGNGLVGNGTFQDAQNFATGTNPFSVVAGDLNTDGRLDLVAANFSEDSVSVLLGNGNGTFQAAANFGTGTTPQSVAIGEFNGDGLPDLAVANRNGATVSVLLGNGNGSFQAAQNFATGSTPSAVAVGDLNGDGQADLAIANYGSNSTSVLLGNGNGTFQAAVNYGTGAAPQSLVLGDVDRDGRLDLAVANRNSMSVSVLMGNGNGTFQTAQNFAVGALPISLTFGDLDGDGQLDLAVANYGGNTVSILMGNGNGTFSAAQNLSAGASPASVAVADVNGDGRLDLLVANYNANTTSVLLGNGNGTFQPGSNLATGTKPVSLSVGDMNGDGHIDLAVANRNGNSVSVLLNAAAGNFTGQRRSVAVEAPRVLSIVPDPAQPGTNVSNPRFVVTFSEAVTGVEAADFAVVPGAGVVVAPGPVGVSGTGTTYTVTVNGVSGAGTLGLNLVDNGSIQDADGKGLVGNGTYQAAQSIGTGLFPRSTAIGDLDGDGRLDVAIAGYGSNVVSVLLGNGNGTFQEARNFPTGANPISVAIGDVNGDGRLDLALANASHNTVSVLRGNGDGTFLAPANFATGTRPYSVAVGDLNGDGRPDLAVANFGSNSVSVLLGNGNSTFQAAQNLTAGANPAAVLVDDLDGDGRLDLAIVNFGSNSASVLLGNGNGTFQLAAMPAVGTQPLSASAGDMNGDGRLDLTVANYGGNSVSVLLGNGNGTFNAAQNFATGPRPISASVADLNGDGRLDLVTPNVNGHAVSMLLGNGNGTFQAAQNFATELFPRSMSVGDVNGDGRLDLAVANSGSNTVSVLLNAANGNFTGQTRAVDTIIPTVSSILRQDPTAAETGADQLTFRVIFSEAVQNVSVGDFALEGTSAGDGVVSSVTPVSASVYDVLITGVTSSNGTIQLLFASGQDIADLATNALSNATPGTSESYTVVNNRQPTALTLSSTTIEENLSVGTIIGTFNTTDPDAGNTFTYTLVAGAGSTDNGSFKISGNTLQSNAVFDIEAKATYSIRVRTTDQDGLSFEQTFTITVTNVNEAPVLDNTGNVFAVLGVGSRQSAEMRQGTLVSDLLARGAGGNPISDPDAGALRGIAVTNIDRTLGTFQYTLVTNNPVESDWINVEQAGAVSDASALLLPTTARLRYSTPRIPHHDAPSVFLALESKLDAGIMFRAWDQTTGVAGGRGNASANGGSTAFSAATETSKVYFEARLFRHFNRTAELNVYTLEAEFNALAAANNPAFEDRSTDAWTGFTVLLSNVPELATTPLYRMYYGVQFNANGTEIDMGYRYLTTNLLEAQALENSGPADKRPQRAGAYFRELGVNSGTGILGYIYTTQQTGTQQMRQIYRTDTVQKPTRPPGTSEGGTPTSFTPQENGDHVYTTNTTFEMLATQAWRIEDPRGFVRPLGGSGIIAPATSAGASATPIVRAASMIDVSPAIDLFNTGVTGTTFSAILPTSLAASLTASNPDHVSTTLDVGLIAIPSAPHLPVVDDTPDDRPESVASPALLSGDEDGTPTATDDLFTLLGSATSDLCPW